MFMWRLIIPLTIHAHIIGSQSKYCGFRPFEMEGVIIDIHPEWKYEGFKWGWSDDQIEK